MDKELIDLYNRICEEKYEQNKLPIVFLPSDNAPKEQLVERESGIIIPTHVDTCFEWPISTEDKNFSINYRYFSNFPEEFFYATIRYDTNDNEYKCWIEDFSSEVLAKNLYIKVTQIYKINTNIIKEIEKNWENRIENSIFTNNKQINIKNYTIQSNGIIDTIFDNNDSKFSEYIHKFFIYIFSTWFRDVFINFNNKYLYSDEFSDLFHGGNSWLWPNEIEG